MKKLSFVDLFKTNSIRVRKKILDKHDFNKNTKRQLLNIINNIDENNQNDIKYQWRFFDVANAKNTFFTRFSGYAACIKGSTNGTNVVINSGIDMSSMRKIYAIGICLDMPFKSALYQEVLTVNDIFESSGYFEQFNTLGAIEITKEEFYNINM